MQDTAQIDQIVNKYRRDVSILFDKDTQDISCCLTDELTPNDASKSSIERIGTLPATYPEWLGDRSFNEAHGTKFAYVGGAMANGIATTKMVIELSRMGALGFFGSAGLDLPVVREAIFELKEALDSRGLPWGVNLIHTPERPQLENELVDLYLSSGVRRVSVSAYMSLSSAVVRFACTGLRRNPQGDVTRENYLFAKVSRPEIASLFMSPPPDAILAELHQKGQLTTEEVELARRVPLADDITVEADSGGHTDRQVLTAILPVILSLRDRLCSHFSYEHAIRVGAAGGLGTSNSVAAAFTMGAAYVLTGTVNQACVESGLDKHGRELLSRASVGDLAMAPSSDMFELGIDLQVLKLGTMFPMRARKLYNLYTQFDSLDEIPLETTEVVEKDILRQSFSDAWADTEAYFATRDPSQIAKANADDKHKMALVFRSYLGQASRWAINGELTRQIDYQIWCGPAIYAFNEWAKGSFLENYENRTVTQVALNLLEGAGATMRASQLQSFGVQVQSTQAFSYRPRMLKHEL